jgi:hypothetical protein
MTDCIPFKVMLEDTEGSDIVLIQRLYSGSIFVVL